MAGNGPGSSSPDPDPTDLAALVFTSGTRGEPKGVMMTHGNLGFLAGSIASSIGLAPSDRILSVLSLAHTYGLSWLIAALDRGGTLFLERSFAYPAVVRERILEQEITVFPGVPTVFAMLLALHRRTPIAFPSVTTVTCAGGALLPSFHPGMREIFPNAGIVHMYGQTECMRVSALPPELLVERPASCGRAIPGTQTMVLSADGTPVGPGEVGTLHVRGPHVTPGYFGAPELTAQILPEGASEPLLCTHDLFRVDDEGFLFFVGRSDEIVKTRGEKVSPTEVENALYAIPGIQEAAVVGVPDEVLGEAIRAYVVVDPEDGLDEAAIVAACRGALESYKVPREVVILDELPARRPGRSSNERWWPGHDRATRSRREGTAVDELTIEREVRAFLQRQLPARRRPVLGPADGSLIELGVVDSTGVLEIVGYIEARYGFEIPIDEISPENLDTIAAITDYVRSKLGAGGDGAG